MIDCTMMILTLSDFLKKLVYFAISPFIHFKFQLMRFMSSLALYIIKHNTKIEIVKSLK